MDRTPQNRMGAGSNHRQRVHNRESHHQQTQCANPEPMETHDSSITKNGIRRHSELTPK